MVDIPECRDVADFTVLYIGDESLTLTSLMMTYNMNKVPPLSCWQNCRALLNTGSERLSFVVSDTCGLAVVRSAISTMLYRAQFVTYNPKAKAARVEILGVSKALMRRYRGSYTSKHPRQCMRYESLTFYQSSSMKGQQYLCTTHENKIDTHIRRYYLVQKAREASVVGILVGTLGICMRERKPI